MHFTHRRQDDSDSTAIGEPVEAWLDRRLGRVTVRSSDGVEVAEGAPYSPAVSPTGRSDDGAVDAVSPPPDTGAVLRPDGLVARRPWRTDESVSRCPGQAHQSAGRG